MVGSRRSSATPSKRHSDDGTTTPNPANKTGRYPRRYSEQPSSTPRLQPSDLPDVRRDEWPLQKANKAIKREDSPSKQLKDSLNTDLKYKPRVPIQATRGQQHLRVLCLDGGGVRGLSSLLILRYLMKLMDPKNPPKPCEVFDMIGGTSTGG